MDTLLDAGLETTRWLQANYPQLTGFFTFISQLGLEEFYLVIIPFIYWSLDKRLGKHLAYIFLFTNSWNVVIKHAFRGPRPFWIDPNVELWHDVNYGIPSGHAQLATAVYLFLAAWFRKGWGWLLAITMVILMGLSRIYLGAHFIHDVIAGTLISIFILVGYYFWQRMYAPKFAKQILGYRLLVAILIPVIIALIYIIVRLIIGAPNMNVAWASYIPETELEAVQGVATALGSLLGAGIGLTLEGSRVRFRVEGSVWQRIGRFLVGIIVTVILWRGLSLIFPADPLWLAIPLRIFRYYITLLWVSFYAPMVFVRLKLATAEPEPQITMTPP
ncbi:MAG: phosphatase PAP2 family protein [Chloroflexota bacterium]|nr:phosphatase PAP2 family protein [Ardenticatenaceae bacterium]